MKDDFNFSAGIYPLLAPPLVNRLCGPYYSRSWQFFDSGHYSNPLFSPLSEMESSPNQVSLL